MRKEVEKWGEIWYDFCLLYRAGLFRTVGPHHHSVNTEGTLIGVLSTVALVGG